MPLKEQKPNLSYASLVGGIIAVLTSLPIAALVSVIFGDTYNERLAIYGGVLLWSIMGVVCIGFITRKSETSFSLRFVLRWFASAWIWPFLLLVFFTKKFKGPDIGTP